MAANLSGRIDMQRWMFVTDTHGDMIDPAARDAAIRFRDAFQPEVRIDGGDVFDFRALRRGASDTEKAEATKGDVAAGESWLRDYAPTQMLWGNHDARILDAIQDTEGDKREYYKLLYNGIMDQLELIGCESFPYDIERGVFKYGDTAFLHGYGASMHVAYQLSMEYGNAVMGHVHQFQESPGRRLDRTVGRTCGCLCRLDMGYNRRRTASLRWSQGFLYGWKGDEGKLHMQSIRPIDGTWHIPTEFPI